MGKKKSRTSRASSGKMAKIRKARAEKREAKFAAKREAGLAYEYKKNPFKIEYNDNMQLPDSQTLSIELALDEWIKTEEWKKRIFNTIRDVLKYGDAFLS